MSARHRKVFKAKEFLKSKGLELETIHHCSEGYSYSSADAMVDFADERVTEVKKKMKALARKAYEQGARGEGMTASFMPFEEWYEKHGKL